MIPNLLAYVGGLTHERHDGHAYRFHYPYACLSLDADHWQAQCSAVGIACDQFARMSVYQRDYAARNSLSWRDFIEQLLQIHGLTQPLARILLLTTPRQWGVGFNPLSMWYAYNQQQQCVAVVAEVSNTFGQWHHYVYHEEGLPLSSPLMMEADKVFHVSPFLEMSMRYQFSIRLPNERGYRVRIVQQNADQQPMLTAVQAGKAVTLRAPTDVKRALRLSPLGVLAAIHWQAFLLWRRGATFFRTPERQRLTSCQHSRMRSCLNLF